MYFPYIYTRVYVYVAWLFCLRFAYAAPLTLWPPGGLFGPCHHVFAYCSEMLYPMMLKLRDFYFLSIVTILIKKFLNTLIRGVTTYRFSTGGSGKFWDNFFHFWSKIAEIYRGYCFVPRKMIPSKKMISPPFWLISGGKCRNALNRSVRKAKTLWRHISKTR